MSIFLDTPETCQRFGNRISEFRSLLDANHIHYGSPDDIFEFAEILTSSKEFRLDLSALVRSVVQKEPEEILLTDMMSIIVTSVGGSSFTDTRSDIAEPTHILMEFLLGTGCWKQFGSPSTKISQNTGPKRTQTLHAVEPPPQQTPPPISTIPQASEDSSAIKEDPENLTVLLDASSELRQMLSKLETNTQQIKHHLDSIEQRINKIEPSSDGSPVETPLQPIPLAHSDSADIVPGELTPPPTDEVPVFDIELPDRSRPVFSQPPQENDFEAPTFSYATEKRRSAVPIAVFLTLLVIIAASFFFFAHSEQRQALLNAGTLRLKAVRSLFSSPPAAVTPAPAADSPSESTPPSTSVAAMPAAPPATPSTSSDKVEAPPAHAAESNGSASDISSDTQPISAKSKIRYIPANIMEGYLLSAPKPQYPNLARVNHIEGNVALQATISKTGSIETLHVIKGPQPLLSAAIDAVRDWHYRPFSIDGRPAEVATTVYVDFSLKQPPETVH
jgi:TonB family protein